MGIEIITVHYFIYKYSFIFMSIAWRSNQIACVIMSIDLKTVKRGAFDQLFISNILAVLYFNLSINLGLALINYQLIIILKFVVN